MYFTSFAEADIAKTNEVLAAMDSNAENGTDARATMGAGVTRKELDSGAGEPGVLDRVAGNCDWAPQHPHSQQL